MRRLGRHIGLLSLTALTAMALMAAGHPARAQADEHVASFGSKLNLSRAGVLNVTETIAYDFGDTDHHGIYRGIPTTYKSDNGRDNYYLTFKLLGVTDEAGRPIQKEESTSSGVYTLKIGDPDRTITGVHTYVINYQLSPIVLAGSDRDRLLYNVTGNKWDVPITRATADLTLAPGQTAGSTINCYTGPIGSTAPNCQFMGSGSHFQASTSTELEAGEGLTINLDLAPGSVTNYLQPNQRPPGYLRQFTGLAVGFLLLLLAGLLWVYQQWTEWRAKRNQTVIAQYEPPDGLKPAEIGLLEDDRSDIREITATLIDLAVRGFIKIKQTKPKAWWGRPAEYTITRLKAAPPPEEYEQTLLTALMSKADSDTIRLKDVDKSGMSTAVTKVKQMLKDRLKAKGYYRAPKPSPRLVRQAALVSVAMVVLAMAITLTAHPTGDLIWVSLLALGGGIVAIVLALRRTRLTSSGVNQWAEVEGFKLFLSVTEKDRLKFSDAPERTPELFNKLLPYAVALKVEEQWAKQFAGIDVAPAAGWYAGTYAFSAASLSDDLSGGFSAAVAGAATVSSSGGGSSGGGFGGGGGGSW
jgi:uncharacterized protein (TIGR04222 family)